MTFTEDPLSSLWFSLFFIVLPVILFVLAIRVIRKFAEEDAVEDDKTDRLKVY